MRRLRGVAGIAGIVVALLVLVYWGARRAGEHDGGLLHAVVEGDAAEVHRYLQAGADPNTVGTGGFTALHLAAQQGSLPIARELLARGANVNARSAPDRFTPLHVACMPGRAAMVRLLLEKGADVHAQSDKGVTPEAVAAGWHHREVVELLHGHDNQR